MAREVDWNLAKRKSLEFVHALDSHGFGVVDQIVVVTALLESLWKALEFYSMYGDRAEEVIEKMFKAKAAEAVEEAEDVLKGEM